MSSMMYILVCDPVYHSKYTRLQNINLYTLFPLLVVFGRSLFSFFCTMGKECIISDKLFANIF